MPRTNDLDELIGLNKDSIMIEFIELATGKQIPRGHKLTVADLNIPISQTLINRLAVLSLATLAYKARRGCTKSSIYLTDRCLGTPQAPFRESVEEMNIDTAKAQLVKEFQGALQVNESLANDIVERLMAADIKEMVG